MGVMDKCARQRSNPRHGDKEKACRGFLGELKELHDKEIIMKEIFYQNDVLVCRMLQERDVEQKVDAYQG